MTPEDQTSGSHFQIVLLPFECVSCVLQTAFSWSDGLICNVPLCPSLSLQCIDKLWVILSCLRLENDKLIVRDLLSNASQELCLSDTLPGASA